MGEKFDAFRATAVEFRERVLRQARRNAFGRFLTTGSTEELVPPQQQWVVDGHFALYGPPGLVGEASLSITLDSTKESPLSVTDFEAQSSERRPLIGPQNILVAIYARIQRSSSGQDAADAFQAMILDMPLVRRERVGEATMRLAADGWQYTEGLKTAILSETELLTKSQWDEIQSIFSSIATPSDRLHQKEIAFTKLARLVGLARGQDADEQEALISQQIKQDFLQGLKEIPYT